MGLKILMEFLVDMFNGNQCIIAQNFQKFMKLKALTAMINNSNVKNTYFDEIQQKMIGTSVKTQKVVKQGNNIVFIGNGKQQILSPAQNFACNNYAQQYSRLQKCPDTRENLMGNRCFRKAKKWSNFHSI
jgi:hypothetical protein